MSKFNKKTTPPPPRKVLNLAGGIAYSVDHKTELMMLVLSSFLKSDFHETSDQRTERLVNLVRSVAQVDPVWVAKLAVFARQEFGMRSVSHVVAAELAPFASKTDWGSRFYSAVSRRADDPSEILGYHYGQGNKITHAMRKGFANYLRGQSAYSLAKYAQHGKQFAMTNVLSLLRMKRPSQPVIDMMDEKLKPAETWEVMLSAAGSDKAAKTEVWRHLLTEDKLGYFALLRNCRNLLQTDDDHVIAMAILRLVDEKAIKSSLVMPFRFTTAYRELENCVSQNPIKGKMLSAISQACDIALGNVPKFDGSTLVVLDCSGSMGSSENPDSPLAKGLILASSLAKANGSDVMMFANNAYYMPIDTNLPVMNICEKLAEHNDGGGTNFASIFQAARQAYDRIIVLTDCQGWGTDNVPGEYKNYKLRHSTPNTALWMFDLTGYGTLMFPESQVRVVSGFSDKVFDMIKYIDQDGVTKMTDAIDEVRFHEYTLDIA